MAFCMRAGLQGRSEADLPWCSHAKVRQKWFIPDELRYGKMEKPKKAFGLEHFNLDKMRSGKMRPNGLWASHEMVVLCDISKTDNLVVIYMTALCKHLISAEVLGTPT